MLRASSTGSGFFDAMLAIAAFAILAYGIDRVVVWRGARGLRKALLAAYDTDWAVTRPSEHAGVDHRFYDAQEAALRTLGFEKLDDVELLAVSRACPRMRTYVRMKLGPDGVDVAAICHARMRGLAGLFLRALGVKAKVRASVGQHLAAHLMRDRA